MEYEPNDTAWIIEVGFANSEFYSVTYMIYRKFLSKKNDKDSVSQKI